MASPSISDAAVASPVTPVALDPSPVASRPPAATAPVRKRPVLLLDQRPHPSTPTSRTAAAAAAAAAAPLSQARRKRGLSSSGRPRWQTALSVAAKNAALLAVLLYLGDQAWRWAHPAPLAQPDDAALAGYTARVNDVEASLARAFGALKVQLEAVDRKIDGEVGAARGELAALLEEKRLAIEGQLNLLDARTDELNDALGGLRRMEFLRKDQFEAFLDEFKESLGSNSGTEVDLDQVRALAREIVMREIEKHAADGVGRVDYAVGPAGGRVVRYSEAYDAGKRGGLLSALPFGGGDNGDQSQKILQPSFGEPGQCFPLKGSSGFVEIQLRKGIIPEAITLEHVSKDVAYDMSTAPKDCRLSGWYQGTHTETPQNHAAEMYALTEFTYDLAKNNIQTFDITAPDVGVVNMVRLDFTSNHGSSALTCIYRIRVHGHEPVTPVIASPLP
ncbi:SUN domain-containing protein 1-like [Triticum dicoccoides]|uniref:SUN domain-containing protein 1-like n=1 Tax=Triticum dicoccoides TaxID=85692 RepID=UPI00188EE150|nr:SUN domain-containing protein 1-like [Triticum dicoccoides]